MPVDNCNFSYLQESLGPGEPECNLITK